MAATAVSAVAPAPAVSPKKAKKTVAKKSATTATSKSNHPPMAKMVTFAIEALNEKKGSSLAAIKKYIVGHYALDIEKQAKYINKALKTAIEKQVIVVRGTGHGLSHNRFRLGKPAVKTTKKTKTTKKPAVEKSTTAKVKKPKVAAKKEQAKFEKTVKKTAEKKPAAEKKATTPKKAYHPGLRLEESLLLHSKL